MHCRDVQLSVDVLHVNEIPLFTSISNHIHYGTANDIYNMKADTLEKGFQSLMRCYATRVFEVVAMLVGVKFTTLKNRSKVGIVSNIVRRGEHVKQTELFRRLIEERDRCHLTVCQE